MDDCKDSGECSEITSVVSVRDLTLGKKQEQPPLPDVPPSGNQKDAVPLPNIPPASTLAEFENLPPEIRSQTEAIVRECHSPVQVLGGFSDDIATNDYRFVLLHFEKIRCDDVTAICKTAGCLHQIYASKDS